MARKESITLDHITTTAVEMTREEGFASVTARKVAVKAGCSTQPIFRVYKNMEELQVAVYLRAVDFFRAFNTEYPKKGVAPFTDLGMAYIAFARQEKHLFRLLFIEDKKNGISMYELLNGADGNVVREINMAKAKGCKDPGGLFMRMWIFIHGAACMTLSGDYDLTDAETEQLLVKAYESFEKV